jgi:dodecin
MSSSSSSPVASIIEVIGISSKGWQDATQTAINEAKKTVRGINRIKKIQDMTADIDESDKITAYKTCVKLSVVWCSSDVYRNFLQLVSNLIYRQYDSFQR